MHQHILMNVSSWTSYLGRVLFAGRTAGLLWCHRGRPLSWARHGPLTLALGVPPLWDRQLLLPRPALEVGRWKRGREEACEQNNRWLLVLTTKGLGCSPTTVAFSFTCRQRFQCLPEDGRHCNIKKIYFAAVCRSCLSVYKLYVCISLLFVILSVISCLCYSMYSMTFVV